LNYCLNHPTSLVHLPDYNLCETTTLSADFLAIQPTFNSDYSKLVFVASPQFLSHSANYELRVIDWQTKQTQTVVEKFQKYPEVDLQIKRGYFGELYKLL
jgi:hypothetical protein